MYSYEDRMRAVKLHILLGERTAATIRELGYLTKNSLKSWHEQYCRDLDLPAGYALPTGSTTLVDQVAEPSPNADDGLDRIHVHSSIAHDDAVALNACTKRLARALAAEGAVLEVRLRLPQA